MESTKSVFSRYAGNLGNLVFDDSLHEWLREAQVLRSDDAEDYASCDHLVLCLANAVSEVPMEPGLAELQSRLRQAMRINPTLQISVASVGAQYFEISTDNVIHPDRLKFIRFLADCAPFLGVRGEYTADLLAQHGIENIWVIGDPALVHPAIESAHGNSSHGVCVGWTPYGKYRDAIGGLLRWSARYEASYVVQEEGEGFTPSPNGRIEPLPRLESLLPYYLWPAFDDANTVRTWALSRGRWFDSFEAWKSFYSHVHVSLSTRFHGNAVALLAGSLALQLVCDTRTLELSRFHQVPHVPLSNFNSSWTPDDIVNLADRESFDRALPSRRRNFEEFMSANGLLPAGLDPQRELTLGRTLVARSPGRDAKWNFRTACIIGVLRHHGIEAGPDLVKNLAMATTELRPQALQDLMEQRSLIAHLLGDSSEAYTAQRALIEGSYEG
jgi:hypothetical protein